MYIVINMTIYIFLWKNILNLSTSYKTDNDIREEKLKKCC